MSQSIHAHIAGGNSNHQGGKPGSQRHAQPLLLPNPAFHHDCVPHSVLGGGGRLPVQCRHHHCQDDNHICFLCTHHLGKSRDRTCPEHLSLKAYMATRETRRVLVLNGCSLPAMVAWPYYHAAVMFTAKSDGAGNPACHALQMQSLV